jgi:hypothetical protein
MGIPYEVVHQIHSHDRTTVRKFGSAEETEFLLVKDLLLQWVLGAKPVTTYLVCRISP